MNTMMLQCKSMHTDDRSCDQEMLTKCQNNADNGDCNKMISDAKELNQNSKSSK